MKKSVLFRVALVMLVLTMVTSCFVGGTFAKYVTSGEGTDSARVAKFGVTVTGNGTAFAEMYNDEAVAAAAYATVVSDGTGDITDLVAPGTKGNMVSIALEGKPEVDVEVKYEAVVDLGDNWVDKDGNYYCPLEIKVGDETIKAIGYAAISAFENDVKAAIEGYTAEYDALTDLSNADVAVPAISWEWPFSTSPENDVKDTYLGDQAALGNAATVALTVKATVTQID